MSTSEDDEYLSAKNEDENNNKDRKRKFPQETRSVVETKISKNTESDSETPKKKTINIPCKHLTKGPEPQSFYYNITLPKHFSEKTFNGTESFSEKH